MLRTAVSIVALLTLFGIPARAQESRSDVFLGLSLLRVNPHNSAVLENYTAVGGDASAAYNISNWFGAVADFAGHYGFGAKTVTYLFGPRISYRHYDRITPFGQILFGGAYSRPDPVFVSNGVFTAPPGQTAFAMAFGFGADAHINSRFSVRLAQAEYLMTRFGELGSGPETQNNFRFSTGLVLHF